MNANVMCAACVNAFAQNGQGHAATALAKIVTAIVVNAVSVANVNVHAAAGKEQVATVNVVRGL